MHRGYLKIWHKITDSRTWSRGLEYRGLLLTLLERANIRSKWFCGVEIQRGQFACSMQNLAQETHISRDKLLRMLAVLKKDEFLHTKAHNQFTVITICNFELYNEQKTPCRTTDNTTGQTKDSTANAQPPHNESDNDRTQLNNARIKETTTTPARARARAGSQTGSSEKGGGAGIFSGDKGESTARWERVCKAFPKLSKKVSRQAVGKLLAGKNGDASEWLAAAATACADDGVKFPLSEKLLAARIEGGVDRREVAKAEKALHPENVKPEPAHYNGDCPECALECGGRYKSGLGKVDFVCPRCSKIFALEEAK